MFCEDTYPTVGITADRSALNRPALTSLVAKARWVLVATIAFSVLLTLLGQPESFWREASTAMRGDGLPLHAPINHPFEFFLSHGPLPFVACNLLYLAAVFLLVSRLPRTLALVIIFTAIFAHGYDAMNWLIVRFHLGIGGAIPIYATALGVLLSFAVLPTTPHARTVVNMWRWLMVAALFVDFTNTLIGQPAGYWLDPTTVHEGNSLSRFFMSRGPIYYFGLDVVEAAVQFALVTFLPLPAAFVCVFAFTFGSFIGASNWFFYEWRLGWGAVIGYAAALSTLMVLLAFRCKDGGARLNGVEAEAAKPKVS